LLERCQSGVRVLDNPNNTSISGDELPDAVSCFTYLRGMVDSANVFNSYLDNASRPKPFFCVPLEVSSGQLARVIVNGLNERAAQLHEGGTYLTFMILGEAFPCS
jgi:hypothetical protein